MQIGRVARKVGLTPDAIRFYERSALLPRPLRTSGGFREFNENDLETLKFIRRSQKLEFTLREVSELLDGLSCRWYFGSIQTGLPPIEMIQRAIRHARQGEA
jgi:DNA-binding transcriptional MerR regulator